jgi:hypothetical protein
LPGTLPRPPEESLLETAGRKVLAITVVNLQGVLFDDPGLYRWLERRRPLAKIGYSIYVYDLTGEAEAHRRLAEAYARMGLPALADRERAHVATAGPATPSGRPP